MRNMSFSITTPQFKEGSKDVTRRWGWYHLKAGDRVMAVEKAMGIPKGGKIVQLGEIEIISAEEEPLACLLEQRVYSGGMTYGEIEVVREGFAQHDPRWLFELLTSIKPKNAKREHPMRIEFRRV